MFKKYFGFDISGCDIEWLQLGIGKHGIQRGYETHFYKCPHLTRVYHYVPVESKILEDSDLYFLVKYSPVIDITVDKLEVLRSKFIEALGNRYVSTLKFYESVGTDNTDDERVGDFDNPAKYEDDDEAGAEAIRKLEALDKDNIIQH